MIRSGLPFNPMRRTPPPPPYIDTFNMIPGDYLNMVSADDHKFVLHRDCACVSPLIRKSLADHVDPALPAVRIEWAENDTSPLTIHFPTVSAKRLEVVIQYLYYKHRYEGDIGERPPFHVPVDAALEVMKLAAILEC